MAFFSSSHFYVSTTISMQPPRSHANSSFERNIREIGPSLMSLVLRPQKLNWTGKRRCYFSKKRWFSFGAFTSLASFASPDQTDGENENFVCKPLNSDMESNLVDCLVPMLHKSARSFSTDIQNCEVARSGLELANAWVGVDVHAWHKHIAYQAAAYALLNTSMKARFLPSCERNTELSLLQEILSPNISILSEFIDSQLTMRDARLVKWFKRVKLPLLESQFIPLLVSWHAEYGKSGAAVIILVISCCIAIKNLGAVRLSCPIITLSIPQIVGELMDLSHKLAAMDKLHGIASDAGLEQEFLAHFGAKVVLNNTSQEVVFWISLVQKKLVVAFHRESVISDMLASHNPKDLERDLATIGLFAFLGRKTRLFLSGMGIKNLDKEVRDFLSYLECGGVFIYPELSSLPLYQLFMEVVTDEIGWLDFYAEIPCINHHERRRSKQHTMQAEKEIILAAVFTACSDVFAGFTHFRNSTRHSLGAPMVSFLQRSENLLRICLEDYWVAYYKSGAERGVPDPVIPLGNPHTTDASVLPIVHQELADLMIMGDPECRPNLVSQTSKSLSPKNIDAVALVEMICAGETEDSCESLLRKSMNKLITISYAITRGTQLLFIDMSVSLGLLQKWICGHKLTQRENKKVTRTMADFAAVIPITILMLLPVSVVGHAAIFAAIQKYIPSLIPSPYSSERLDTVKQLNRIKKNQVQSQSFLRNSIKKLRTMSCAITRGTQWLFIEMTLPLCLLLKWICGHKLTERETQTLTQAVVNFAESLSYFLFIP